MDLFTSEDANTIRASVIFYRYLREDDSCDLIINRINECSTIQRYVSEIVNYIKELSTFDEDDVKFIIRMFCLSVKIRNDGLSDGNYCGLGFEFNEDHPVY